MSIDDATAAEWDRIKNATIKNATDEEWFDADRKSRGTWRKTMPLPDPVGWLDKASEMERYDTVDKPAHYNNGAIEAIDYIKQQLGENFYAYCEGNVHKYIHRYSYKNGVEDLRKARWYLDRLIKELCSDGN